MDRDERPTLPPSAEETAALAEAEAVFQESESGSWADKVLAFWDAAKLPRPVPRNR